MLTLGYFMETAYRADLSMNLSRAEHWDSVVEFVVF
jgi:hypothetical protein